MKLKNTLFLTLLATLGLLAADNYFKYRYGRSLLVHTHPRLLDAGILACFLFPMGMAYQLIVKEQKRAARLATLASLAAALLVMHLIGLGYRREDVQTSQALLASVLNAAPPEAIVFGNPGTQSAWLADHGKSIQRFEGCYAWQRRCDYLVKGQGSYRVNIFLGAPEEIRVAGPY